MTDSLITDNARRGQIDAALAARENQNGETRSHPLPWHGSEKYFPIVEVPIDVPLLNAESHRIRAYLEAPGLKFVREEKTTPNAQLKLSELWAKAHRKFDQLVETLSVEGQNEPGVITREGVMIDGNTRLVALRELNDPNQKWIKVAVLDVDAREDELAQLELRLQVRDPVRDPYRLSNELLFIEEMAREFRMSEEEIAYALAWNPTKPAVGKKKVAQYRKLLQLIRAMQASDPNLPITFFDDGSTSGKLQHLKELEQKHTAAVEAGDLEFARLLLDTWLVVARSGYSSVHQIRAVTRHDDFVEDFLLPRLEENDVLQSAAESLVKGKRAANTDLPGLAELEVDVASIPANHGFDVKPLLRLVESADDPLTLPGVGVPIAAEKVKGAIATAVGGAVRDYQADGKAEDAINAPVDALRKAEREIKRAAEAYAELSGNEQFREKQQGAFEYQLKHVKKRIRELDEIVGRSESGH